MRARQEEQRLKEKNRPTRKSRSYSRGKSVYFDKEDPNVPYYRSKSVDYSKEFTLTFEPVVNEQNVINVTYTGRARSSNMRASHRSRRSRRGSGIVQKRVRSVPPHMRDEYTFDDLTTRIYQQIQKVYGEPDADEKHKQFFLTLAQIQSDHIRMKNMKITGDDRKFLEKMFSEVQNLKRETGRILRNSTKRYSTQFEQPSPVNAKLLNLPRGSREENFLKELPRSREKLRLKPLKAGYVRDRRTYQYGGYGEYDRHSRRRTPSYMDQYQVAKGPNQTDERSHISRFLQQAENLLLAYKTGLLEYPVVEKTHLQQHRNMTSSITHQDHRGIKLNPLPAQKSSEKHISSSSRIYNNSSRQDLYDRSFTQKDMVAILPSKPAGYPTKPVYQRPEGFYDARQHMKLNSVMTKVDQRLNETRNRESDARFRIALYGLAK